MCTSSTASSEQEGDGENSAPINLNHSMLKSAISSGMPTFLHTTGVSQLGSFSGRVEANEKHRKMRLWCDTVSSAYPFSLDSDYTPVPRILVAITRHMWCIQIAGVPLLFGHIFFVFLHQTCPKLARNGRGAYDACSQRVLAVLMPGEDTTSSWQPNAYLATRNDDVQSPIIPYITICALKWC